MIFKQIFVIIELIFLQYKDMIIRGGVNISPSSIEEILAAEFGLTADVVAGTSSLPRVLAHLMPRDAA